MDNETKITVLAWLVMFATAGGLMYVIEAFFKAFRAVVRWIGKIKITLTDREAHELAELPQMKRKEWIQNKLENMGLAWGSYKYIRSEKIITLWKMTE